MPLLNTADIQCVCARACVHACVCVFKTIYACIFIEYLWKKMQETGNVNCLSLERGAE